MTDHDANHAQHRHEREPARGSGSRERRSMGSYETGESSTMGRLTSSLSMTDTTLTQRSSSEMPATSPSASHGSTQDHGQSRREERRRSHRINKNRSSGAFLLSGALDGSPREAHEMHKRHQARKHQISDLQEQQYANTNPDRPQESDTTPVRTERYTQKERLSVPGSQQPESHGDTPPRLPSQASNNTLLDLDSTQIVNMALNLSESRRLAARRNVSHPLPPRLAPLPDSSVGGSLRQQLQQQRRTSRTVSPKPDRGSRIVSGPRLASPLQSTFDPIDGSYRYHFSQSTLSRAQKAKDYMELLAQYRRVLELVPPLKPEMIERIATASPPSSPAHTNRTHYFGAADPGAVILGREYNPLQYIRNRKVRARERKAIDGEGQGFGDLTRVTDWVDGVAKWAATGQSQTPGGTLLPPFAGADESLMHNSPPSNSSRPSVVVNKPKRPRVDWVIDPADMLADVYWLEQGDNKKLVEDRDWHRVFPQDPEIYRPISQQTEDGNAATAPNLAKKAETIPIVEKSIADTNSPRAEQERTRKTRHKLQHLRGRHHRQGSSVASNDIYRSRKASFSDTSDSDSDPKPRRRRMRQDTITAGGKDILEKQMAEMIAREEREREARGSYELDLQRTRSTNNDLTTPDKPRSGSSTGPSRGPSRRGSHGAELSGSDEKLPIGRPELGSPIKTGRASLEVPLTGRRLSVDYNVSQPPSPGIRPIDVGFVPGIGADFTPSSSRPGSPPRKPFSKVKNIFRDRSRERSMDRSNDLQEEQGDVHASSIGEPVDTPATLSPTQTRVERRPSRSPARKTQSKSTSEGHKAHRSIGSMRLRSEESSGLRSLLKTGPRIDSVLRNGVSKVSELFWRKDDDDQTSNTSSSDSEDEAITRGRSRGSAVPSRATSQRRNDETLKAKHYLSVMPIFQSTQASHDRLNARDQSPISRPPSRRSFRFDLLKPPKIDIQSASPSDTPPRELSRTRDGDADVSSSQSRKGSIADDNSRAAGARLNRVLCLPEPLATQRSRHLSASSHGTRHWSLSDRSPSPHPAQDASQLTRREVARLRAMILGSGIVATEIARRVNEPRLLPEASSSACSTATTGALRWAEIVALSPQRRDELAGRPVSQRELYTAAARVLGQSVQASGQRWQASADRFAGQTTPALRERVEGLRGKLAADLSGMTRTAADEADGVVNDLLEGQRLKVKRVVDVIDKMSRRRRRRFRWVRRAGWLGVEWILVGFMWYVWFVVMIARVVWGIGSGLFAGVRWLLWL